MVYMFQVQCQCKANRKQCIENVETQQICVIYDDNAENTMIKYIAIDQGTYMVTVLGVQYSQNMNIIQQSLHWEIEKNIAGQKKSQ